MRDPNSNYDRGMQRSTESARPLVERLASGETLSYEDVDHLDDAAWNNHLRDIVQEVPGEGYRLGLEASEWD